MTDTGAIGSVTTYPIAGLETLASTARETAFGKIAARVAGTALAAGSLGRS